MIGVILGDIIGSIYELNNYRAKDFELFKPESRFTDDTVMSLAVCAALLNSKPDFSDLYQNTVRSMQHIGRLYPYCGYGRAFFEWIFSDNPVPYNSYGNGSAMRVSPCAYAADSIDRVIELAKIVAETTHNHPEGVKGAEAVAAAVFLARTGSSKSQIRDFISERYYKIDFTLDSIRDTYRFSASCQGSVPQALAAFFEAVDFEDTIRNAVSVGGDSDTIAAIAASVAEPYYGVPAELRERALGYLDERLLALLNDFESKYPIRSTKA